MMVWGFSFPSTGCIGCGHGSYSGWSIVYGGSILVMVIKICRDGLVSVLRRLSRKINVGEAIGDRR